MTHCRSLVVASRSAAIGGSARFTIVMSIWPMKMARQITASAYHRADTHRPAPCPRGATTGVKHVRPFRRMSHPRYSATRRLRLVTSISMSPTVHRPAGRPATEDAAKALIAAA